MVGSTEAETNDSPKHDICNDRNSGKVLWELKGRGRKFRWETPRKISQRGGVGAELWWMSPGFCSWKKEPEELLWGNGQQEQRLECLSRKFGLDSVGFIPYRCDYLIIFYQLPISPLRAEGMSFIHIFSIILVNLSTPRAYNRCSRSTCQSNEQGWF